MFVWESLYTRAYWSIESKRKDIYLNRDFSVLETNYDVNRNFQNNIFILIRIYADRKIICEIHGTYFAPGPVKNAR